MSTQTIISIVAIVAAILVVAFIVLYVLSDTFYFRKQEKEHKRSVKVREEITQQADAVRQTMKDNNVEIWKLLRKQNFLKRLYWRLVHSPVMGAEVLIRLNH